MERRSTSVAARLQATTAGIAANKLKYVELQDDIVTVDQFDEAHEKWLADREAAK